MKMAASNIDKMKCNLLLFVSLTINLGAVYNINCLAQSPESYAIWFLPYAQYRTVDSTVFALQPGYNPQLVIGLLYANSTIKARRWLNVNLGYMFLALPGQNNNESTLMNGITLKFHVHKFLIENQNLVWNRFRSIRDSYHFDRNKTRLFYEVIVRELTFSPYLLEEFWFYFTSKTITRNRTGLGVLFTIKSRLSFDLLYTNQWDRFNGNSTVFFLRSAVVFN
ncbi:DUF2490 domain-containing protein [Fibrisoma limi]|uniref:DUF2490 domain-containing protein n=1 Tax=Fibrisoma limi TaxID=663275 RepID=UPI00058713E9